LTDQTVERYWDRITQEPQPQENKSFDELVEDFSQKTGIEVI
jgi:hypothetical protein